MLIPELPGGVCGSEVTVHQDSYPARSTLSPPHARSCLSSAAPAPMGDLDHTLTRHRDGSVRSPYPGVGVQQAAGDDGAQEGLMCGDDVVQVLRLPHLVPQLVPGALKHLEPQPGPWEAGGTAGPGASTQGPREQAGSAARPGDTVWTAVWRWPGPTSKVM